MPFLRRLYRSLRAEELAATGWPEPAKAAFCNDQFALQHTDWTARFPRGRFLLVLHRREPIGRFYLDLDDHAVTVVDIGLVPEWRGKGVGAALIAAAQHLAAASGHPVRLHVLRTNRRARDLYRRLGFVEAEEVGQHLAMVWTAPLSTGAAAAG